MKSSETIGKILKQVVQAYKGKPRQTVEERFWTFVDKRSENACWEWTGNKVHGYGTFRFGVSVQKAHRVSWVIHNGEIPSGNHHGTTCVLHTCDNPSCVNPKHLRLGTQQDNVNDMFARGRQAPTTRPYAMGELNGCSRLTESDVIRIRKLHPETNQHQLAKMFGVAVMTINRAIRRISWSHI